MVIYETHSLTEDNEKGIATGWLPGKLSDHGRRLAAELGTRRSGTGISAVFASDLHRAVETAQIAFGATPIPIHQDPRLRECNLGIRLPAGGSLHPRPDRCALQLAGRLALHTPHRLVPPRSQPYHRPTRRTFPITALASPGSRNSRSPIHIGIWTPASSLEDLSDDNHTRSTAHPGSGRHRAVDRAAQAGRWTASPVYRAPPCYHWEAMKVFHLDSKTAPHGANRYSYSPWRSSRG